MKLIIILFIILKISNYKSGAYFLKTQTTFSIFQLIMALFNTLLIFIGQ